MKFYSKLNASTIVWDKEKNRVLCKFEHGVFETDDEYIINMLQELGFYYVSTKVLQTDTNIQIEKDETIQFGLSKETKMKKVTK